MNARKLLEGDGAPTDMDFTARRPMPRRPGGGGGEAMLNLSLVAAALAAHADPVMQGIALAVINGQPIPDNARQHIVMEAQFLASKLPAPVQAHLDQLKAQG